MIKVIMEFDLIYPYKISLMTLLDFNRIWDCKLIKAGTSSEKAIISMSVDKFKKIFGENPNREKYKVPKGMTGFIESVKVRKIKAD